MFHCLCHNYMMYDYSSKLWQPDAWESVTINFKYVIIMQDTQFHKAWYKMSNYYFSYFFKYVSAHQDYKYHSSGLFQQILLTPINFIVLLIIISIILWTRGGYQTITLKIQIIDLILIYLISKYLTAHVYSNKIGMLITWDNDNNKIYMQVFS